MVYPTFNTTGTINILELVRRAGVQRITFSASLAAYSDSETLPKIETMPVLAKSPYPTNKVTYMRL
ncbi:NAD-dependent epimerase/dehydratase family protein [Poriferisphaera corsica]|uniref:NAD-dependent epimerase/dehydratase family protein n=1 Tax=Poriferisphaera corsica TaxID=2528020 RepID=UPI0011A92961